MAKNSPATRPVQSEQLDAERALYLGDATPQDEKAAADAIVQRILSAESVEDVLRASATQKAEDVCVGQLFTLHDVEFRESEYDGSPAYALLHISRPGSPGIELVTCGGRNVLAQAHQLRRLGALPKGGLTMIANKTRGGFETYWLTESSSTVAAKSAEVHEAEMAAARAEGFRGD